jgi:2-dehydropantoate 2-reductase
MARRAGEAVATGLDLGFAVEDIFGLAPDKWLAASHGGAAAVADAGTALRHQTEDMEESALSGMAQDLAKGRRTEIEYMNGYVAAKAVEAGRAASTHAAIVSLVTKMERGAAWPGQGVGYLLDAVEGRGEGPCSKIRINPQSCSSAVGVGRSLR